MKEGKCAQLNLPEAERGAECEHPKFSCHCCGAARAISPNNSIGGDSELGNVVDRLANSLCFKNQKQLFTIADGSASITSSFTLTSLASVL